MALDLFSSMAAQVDSFENRSPPLSPSLSSSSMMAASEFNISPTPIFDQDEEDEPYYDLVEFPWSSQNNTPPSSSLSLQTRKLLHESTMKSLKTMKQSKQIIKKHHDDASIEAKQRKRSCLCGRGAKCGRITSAFFMLDKYDPRSGYQKVPSITNNYDDDDDDDDDYDTYLRKQVRKSYLRRINPGSAGHHMNSRHHLMMNLSSSQPRKEGDPQKERSHYIANHHFHPNLLNKYLDLKSPEKTQLPWTISEAHLIECHLEKSQNKFDHVLNHEGLSEGYRVLTPTYKFKDTKKDLMVLLKKQQDSFHRNSTTSSGSAQDDDTHDTNKNTNVVNKQNQHRPTSHDRIRAGQSIFANVLSSKSRKKTLSRTPRTTAVVQDDENNMESKMNTLNSTNFDQQSMSTTRTTNTATTCASTTTGSSISSLSLQSSLKLCLDDSTDDLFSTFTTNSGGGIGIGGKPSMNISSDTNNDNCKTIPSLLPPPSLTGSSHLNTTVDTAKERNLTTTTRRSASPSSTSPLSSSKTLQDKNKSSSSNSNLTNHMRRCNWFGKRKAHLMSQKIKPPQKQHQESSSSMLLLSSSTSRTSLRQTYASVSSRLSSSSSRTSPRNLYSAPMKLFRKAKDQLQHHHPTLHETSKLSILDITNPFRGEENIPGYSTSSSLSTSNRRNRLRRTMTNSVESGVVLDSYLSKITTTHVDDRTRTTKTKDIMSTSSALKNTSSNNNNNKMSSSLQKTTSIADQQYKRKIEQDVENALFKPIKDDHHDGKCDDVDGTLVESAETPYQNLHQQQHDNANHENNRSKEEELRESTPRNLNRSPPPSAFTLSKSAPPTFKYTSLNAIDPQVIESVELLLVQTSSSFFFTCDTCKSKICTSLSYSL